MPVLFLASVAAAQETREPPSRERQPRAPGHVTAPAGLCRVWIEGVPASQQPAPTDCASAIRNRPSNAAVIFGPPARGGAMDMEPFATKRSTRPMVRQWSPEARKEEREHLSRDDARGRTADSTAKPAPRKPEKPQ